MLVVEFRNRWFDAGGKAGACTGKYVGSIVNPDARTGKMVVSIGKAVLITLKAGRIIRKEGASTRKAGGSTRKGDVYIGNASAYLGNEGLCFLKL